MTLDRRFWSFVVAALVVTVPSLVIADDPKPSEKPEVEAVEFFKAIDEGIVEVKLVQKNPAECRLVIENKTKEPVRLALPAAFAGVPYMAQFDGGGFGGGGGFDGGGGFGNDSGYGGSSSGGSSRSGGNQSTGGGMGGMGGMSGGYGGGGMFSIEPEATVAQNLDTVCLEYGKRDPNSSMRYVIRPIETVTKNKAVHELCATLGNDKISQEAAQVAAWHLNNGLSWQQLLSLQIPHLGGNVESMFNRADIRTAMMFTDYAAKKLKAAGKNRKPSGSMAD